MGDIVAAVVGYLIGMEDARPRVRSHRLALITAAIFMLGNFALDLSDGSEWSWAGLVYNLLLSAFIYGFTFLVLKWWDRSKRRRK